MNYIFYIPGFGDQYDTLRRFALQRWRRGVVAELIPMDWYGSESYEAKYHRAQRRIQEALDSGHGVSLVGESAGGSMALSLFAQMPDVLRVVTVAGFNNSSQPAEPSVLRRAPALNQSLQAVEELLTQLNPARRSSIHTLNGLLDKVVGIGSSKIPGARTHRVVAIGHLFTIAVCLTLQKNRIVRYAVSSGRSSMR